MRQACVVPVVLLCLFGLTGRMAAAQDWWKPYSPPCTERENVFEFTEKPSVKHVGKDRYEITFAVKGYCDVTVAIVDPDPAKELVKGRGIVVRHLASGVLGPNAPEPFQKNSLRQTLYWNGKDDLDIYHKTPEKLVVRVMLGLKPEFDKRLGGTSPHNIPGRIIGLAADPSGVYVASACGRQRLHLRHFDHDGSYVKSLTCPPASMPHERLTGMGYIEYEPGKRAVHGPTVYQTVADHMRYLDFLGAVGDCQPAIAAGKIFFVNDGKYAPSKIFSVHLDGSTDLGVRGRDFAPGSQHNAPRLAASPDGRWIYATDVGADNQLESPHRVLRMPADGSGPAKVFCGESGKPGSDERRLNHPRGLDTDAAGRLYVCDHNNNRVQVFNADGTFFRTIPVERPFYIAVHKKTGAIYVQHNVRLQGGNTVRRTTKLASVDDPKPVARVDEGPRGLMALDSWSARPRLWSSAAETIVASAAIQAHGRHNITIWEEQDGTFVRVADFDQMAREADGPLYAGRWSGAALGYRVACDATREEVYIHHGGWVFDLPSGVFKGTLRHQDHPGPDDIVFDKRGYLHGHLRPTTSGVGVFRLDPARRWFTDASNKTFMFREVPYDYGLEIRGYRGALPTRCQAGSKGFSDGLGVNMRGDVVVQSNIYYVPRMEDVGRESGWGFQQSRRAWDPLYHGGGGVYENFQRWIQDMEKQGQEVYYIRRRPGIPLAGATAWVFDATGELRRECAVIAGRLMAGVQIDEDRSLYLTSGRPKAADSAGTAFLAGRGGTFGLPDDKTNRDPFTGTVIKTQPDTETLCLKENAPVRVDPLPDRPPDMTDGGDKGRVWVTGHEWLYAGASPVVAGGCSCPSHRVYIDWFRRLHVPEAYRHSIGVVDTAGNLILHIGQYGNYDDVRRMKPGDTSVAMSAVRYISGTDNYLVFDDHGEGITVLRLNYHREEIVKLEPR